ncbi:MULTISPECIES: N-acetylglucosamine/diacetylchitobiose ABC transporter substrate-binding protein [unclassified Nonomuraea]|uniref:N-acetylglucosamine/diacetylchitobiose ABC transporter substrate-binding protein n=1 Tax=unclassified Nonomuraea TaxID=2593643 RepID=UPI0033FBB0C5
MNHLSRRQLLRGAALTGAGLLATACATPGDPAATRPAATGARSAANPLGLDENGPLEIVIFDGGLGDAYATTIHEPLFLSRHPKVRLKHSSTKEISGTLQPRFVGGNPPEVINNDGAQALDLAALVQGGQLQDLTPLLEVPSWDDPGTKVRDVLLPAAIEAGSFDGRPYSVPYVFMIFGFWHSAKLFAQKGWTAPATWDEFLTLCGTMKKAGIAPFAYAGKYPGYVWEAILTMAVKHGGPEVMKRVDNLEDGAWQADALTAAAGAFGELHARGFLLQGTEGLNHTESQARQNSGEVAVIPNGSWLENEQKKVAPADFGYAMFPVPALEAAEAMPGTALHAMPGSGFVVAARSRNPAAGMEYLRAMVSREGAGKYSGLVSTLTTVRGAALPPQAGAGLRSAAAALEAAGTGLVNWRVHEWYKEIATELDAATGQLMTGGITAAQWAERLQRKADAVKKDSSIKKFSR